MVIQTREHTHTSLSHIVDHVWFSCSLALTLMQSRLVEICSPCCLIFPPLATFPGTAPPATPRGAGRTGMASTCLPGLFSVFFPFQLIPLCPLHGFSSANYKSSPTPSDSLDSRDLQSTSLSSSERSGGTSACVVSLALLFSMIIVLCNKLGYHLRSPFQV